MSEYITKNFTYDELTGSTVAKRLGLDNTPSEVEKKRIVMLANEVLQPIRDAWKSAIIVNSAYRSEEVNKAVGGVKNSQHRKGEAADITVGSKERNKKLFNFIQKLINNGTIEVGQLIDEYHYSWIHVSLPRSNAMNNQILHLG